MNELKERFGGIARLYGTQGLEKLLSSHVLVVGIGGVGSWTAEALARSGVGKITLVDLDDVCITNTNRQLHAMKDTIGKLKIHVTRDRIKEINPFCEVVLVEDFFTEKNADDILSIKYDFVVDAIDSLSNKCILASKCYEKNIPVIITGGAAGKIDPAKVQICDIGECNNDSLIFRMRKQLRRDFSFPSGKKSTPTKRQKFNLMCVYSPEDTRYPKLDGTISCDIDPESNLKMDCETGMGSVSHLTGLFGLMAAGHVINSITKES